MGIAGRIAAAVAWGFLEARVPDPLIDVHALLAVPVPRQPGHAANLSGLAPAPTRTRTGQP